MANMTISTTHQLSAMSQLTYVQRLGNRIDDEAIANTRDDEDARIKDAKTMCREGAPLYAAPVLGAHQSAVVEKVIPYLAVKDLLMF